MLHHLWMSEGMLGVSFEDEPETAGKWGFMDDKGKLVIAQKFDEVGAFSLGLAAVRIGEKWGYIDKNGRMSIAPRFAEAMWFRDVHGGLAAVREGASPESAPS